MRIEYIELADLPAIVAGLVREGVTFRAYPKDAFWVVELTGGH